MNDKLRICNPYPGLRFFKQEEEKMFFGRVREIRELKSLLIAHRVVLLYSKSGAGKTSLVNAGVIPSLITEEGFEVLPVARVRGLGREAKEPKGMQNRYIFNVLRSWAKDKADSTELAQMSLSAFLKQIVHPIDQEGLPSRRLVIFDQFEELFTFEYLKSREDRKGFFRQVAQAIQEDDLLRVLFVIREDYLANLDPYIEFLPELLRSKYRLERLREDAACEAIEKPLKGTGRMFAQGVASSLVQKLLAGGEYVEPLQLQVVCRYLWDELDALEEKYKEKFTLITSELLGKVNVDEALKLLYEQAIERAEKETGVKKGDLRNWFESQLITPAGTRGTVFQDPVSKECTGGIPNTVVKVLEVNSLIRAEERAGAQWYELTHDLLIGPIQKSNEAWREEKQRQQVKAECQRTQAEEKAKFDGQLAKMSKWLVVVSIIAIIAAILAFYKLRDSQKLAKQLDSKRLALAAVQNLNIDPESSILLALQAASISLSASNSVLQDVKDALNQSVQASRLKVTLRGHDRDVYCVASSPNGKYIVTGSSDKSVRVWDADVGKELFKLEGHKGPVLDVAFNSDGKRIITASADGTARVWDTEGRKKVLTLSLNGMVFGTACSPNGKYIATAGADGTVKVWDAKIGKELWSKHHKDWVTDVAFSPDGKWVGSASRDKTAKIWNAETGRELFTLPGHDDWVTSITFSPDGRLLATASWDKTAKLWGAQKDGSWKLLRTFLGHNAAVCRIAFSPDTSTLVTTSFDSSAKVWEVVTGKEIMTLHGHEGAVYGLSFSPGGKYLFTASQDKTVKKWIIISDEGLHRVRGCSSDFSGIAISPGEGRVAVAKRNETVLVLDAFTGSVLKRLKDHREFVYGVTFNHLGDRLATASKDKTAKVWDDKTGKVIRSFDGHTDEVMNVAFSPDGRRLATASADKTAKVWEAETGKELYTLTGHGGTIYAVIFSRDGKKIATASADKTAKVWEVETGKELYTLTGHGGAIYGVAFSREGKWIATAGGDKTAKVWEVETGKELYTLTGHADAVYGVIFSQDGKQLITTTKDNIARVFVLDTNELLKLARRRVTRSLTGDECKMYFGKPPMEVTAIGLFIEGKNSAQSGDIEGAALKFEEALKLDPTLNFTPKDEAKHLLAQVYFEKGMNLYRQGKSKESADFLEKAVGMGLEDLYLFNRLGAIYHDELFEYEEAYRKLKQAYKLDPEDKQTFTNFVEANLATGRFKEAYTLAQKVLTERKDTVPLEVDEKLTMQFIIIASLAFQGNMEECHQVVKNFVEFYRSVVIIYAPKWKYKGTRNFIKQKLADKKKEQDLLLKLIDILEMRQTNITTEEIERFFK